MCVTNRPTFQSTAISAYTPLVAKARVGDDKGRLRHELAANLGDLPLREYLTAQPRAPTVELQPATAPHKDVLTLVEATACLGMGKCTLHRRVKADEIRRSQGFKCRRVDWIRAGKEPQAKATIQKRSNLLDRVDLNG